MTVTALDTYGHVVTEGNPDFQLDCPNCTSLLRSAPTILSPGLTRFTFSYTTATPSSTHRLLLNSTGQVLREDTISVRAANATAAASRLAGPAQWQAGEDAVFEFEPFDSFGNRAVYAENTTDNMDVRAVLREVSAAGAAEGADVELPVELRSDGLVYDVTAPVSVVNKTGEYYAIVQLYQGEDDERLRSGAELRIFVRVTYAQLDMAQSRLEVRPEAETDLLQCMDACMTMGVVAWGTNAVVAGVHAFFALIRENRVFQVGTVGTGIKSWRGVPAPSFRDMVCSC